MLTFKGKLGIDDFFKIIFKDQSILIDDEIMETVEKSF